MQKNHIKNVLIIFIIILFLELTVFNLNSYRVFSSKNAQVFGKDSIEYLETEDKNTIVKVSNVNKEIKTIHIEVDNYDTVPYQVLYKDEANSNFLDTPAKMYINSLRNSKYIPLYLSGNSRDFEVVFDAENVSLSSITINEKIPMNFSIARVLVLFGIITFIYCIRNLEVFNTAFSNKNFEQELILLVILGIFLCIICFVNDYSKEKNKYDFYSYDFVKALSHGKIYLESEPDERLLKMENPYDANDRWEEDVLRTRDYIWDAALYNGRYYVYFGILPVLILFLPYYLITGNMLISAVGVLVFSILSAIAIKALVEIVFTRFFKEIQFKYVVFSLLIMLFGSQILILNGIPRFYEVPISAGLFFAISGVDFILMATYGKRKYLKILFGTLFLALSVACRPTMLLVSLIVIPILLKLLIENVKAKKGIVEMILVIVIPYLLVGVLLMTYNYVRFGNVLEFGAKYQLTIADMGHLSNRKMTIGMGLICNLFSIPNFIPNFPFIGNHNDLLTFYGYYYIENMIGGLFILVPMCFAIFKFHTIYKKSTNRELVGFILSLILVAMLICVISIMMAGSMQRYIVDYGWIFTLAGICVFVELQNIYKTSEAKYILKKVFAYITIYVVIINMCSGIVSEKSFMKNKSPEKYYELKYTVDFWE